MNEKLSPSPKVFFQDCPPYRHEILVSVGATPKEIMDYSKSVCSKKTMGKIRKHLKESSNLFEQLRGDKMNGFAVLKNDNSIYLLLKEYSDAWDFWELLIHELHHIVGYITDLKHLEGEIEAQAYLQEHLFHEIRRKIQGVEPI